MEEDEMFDDVRPEDLKKKETIPFVVYLSPEAFKVLSGLRSIGYSVDEEIFASINALILKHSWRFEG